MIVTIHQPQYLPWLPYFDKILRSDVFVFLDHVQFEKNGMQNRNQIKSPQGASWITVPVRQRLGQTILETELSDVRVTTKHLRTLEMNYKKAPHYAEVIAAIGPILAQDHSRLCDLNVQLTLKMLDAFGYAGKILRSSELSGEGESSALVLDLCRKAGARTYLSGQGGRAYMKLDEFKAAGIEVLFQKYQGPEYEQRFPQTGFVPHLSAIDLLFNAGPGARKILESGQRPWEAP